MLKIAISLQADLHCLKDEWHNQGLSASISSYGKKHFLRTSSNHLKIQGKEWNQEHYSNLKLPGLLTAVL